MGIDIKFIRVDQEAFQSLRDGETEIDDLEPNMRLLPRNERGQVEPSMQLAYRYACNSNWTEVKEHATKLNLSEKALKEQVKELGFHFSLDTSREWNELHMLLTGEYALDRLKSGAMSDDLFSRAIVAGRNLAGDAPSFGDFGDAYLDPSEVRQIASKLETLTYELLSQQNKVTTGVRAESMLELFDSFKTFFLAAAEEDQVVVRQTM